MGEIACGMHEHVCDQLNGIEAGGFEIVQSAEFFKAAAYASRQHYHGQPHYEIDDYEVFGYRGHVPEY